MRHPRVLPVMLLLAAALPLACSDEGLPQSREDAPAKVADAAADTADAIAQHLDAPTDIPQSDLPAVATDAGADSGVIDGLAVDGSSIDGPGQASYTLLLSASSVNLGSLEAGASAMASVTLTNPAMIATGPVTLTPSAGMTATGCAGPLPARSSCSITIIVTPTAMGPWSGTLAILANPGAITPLLVNVVADVSAKNMFSVTPSTLDLGNVVTGVPAPNQSITVTAKVALSDLGAATTSPDVAFDRTATTCTATLAANSSCVVVVRFLAATSGSKTEAVVVTAGGAAGFSLTVPITANAQYPAKLAISPSTPQTFTVSVGSTSSPIPFLVQNTGDMATGVVTAAITGTSAAEFTATSNCLVLSPLASCTVSVAYKPSATAMGTASAALLVTDSGASGSPVSVPLVGVPVSGPRLTISSSQNDLGTVQVGATGTSTVFTVTNSGDTTSGLLTVSVSSPEFVVTNDTCTSTTLAKGTMCAVSLALRPTSVGAKSAILVVSASSGNPSVMTISGIGVTAP